MLLCDNEKKEILEHFSERPRGKCITEKSVFKCDFPTLDLSIIVPCYNIEAYLEQCLDSLLNQSTDISYEIIAIDDGATDATGTILDKYQKMSKNLKVIHQENKGLSGARNRGIEEANGKYLMFVDSDDYVSENYIDSLTRKALDNDADMVACGYSTFVDNKVIKNVKPNNDIDSIHGCAWGKVFRRDLFEKIRFPEGYWYEDSIYRHLILPQIEKYYVEKKPIYFYRRNRNGITQSSIARPKAIDTLYITDLMISSLKYVVSEDYMLSDRYYRILINQFYLNQQRILKLPTNIQEIVFEIQVNFLKKFFHGFEKKHKSTYEKAVFAGNFKKSIYIIKLNKIYKIIDIVRKKIIIDR